MNGRTAKKIRKVVFRQMYDEGKKPSRTTSYTQRDNSQVCTGYRAVVKIAKTAFKRLNRLQKKRQMAAIRTV